MSENKLILIPKDAEFYPPEPEKIVSGLQNIGFIAASIDSPSVGSRYHAGERFLDLITFVGCSPVVMTGDEHVNNSNFYHIHISHTSSTPFLIISKQCQPRCPHCRKPVANWNTALSSWQDQQERELLICSHCGGELDVFSMAWRREGGGARLFIEIIGVFPHEAIPSDELLEQLADDTGIAWDYFYYS